jgi:hypothetical protein
LIGVGQFISNELRNHHAGRYGRWLADAIGTLRVTNPRTVLALEQLGVRIATTNYDGLIEAASRGLKSPITWRQGVRVTAYFRVSTPEVLHLHGHYLDPESVVLGDDSYERVCRDGNTQDALRMALRFKTFVFVGCGRGLNDPNFGGLLRWARTTLEGVQHEHYLLALDDDVGAWRNDLRGLPISPIGYGSSHGELAPFLERLGASVLRRRGPSPHFALSAAQADFDTQWNAIAAADDGVLPAERFRRFRELARALAEAGGVHRAAMAFSGEVTFRGEGLTAAEYVEFSLDAAEWLLADDVAELAQHHLARAERHVRTGDVPADQVERFRRLLLGVMDALCAYNETLQTIADQLTRATGEERERLEAERAEIRLLQGDFDPISGDDS